MGKANGLSSMPAVFPGNEWLFDAWATLDTCRSIGMAMGPIPWTAAAEYARHKGLDDEGFYILWGVIHRADTAYRSELSDANK